MEQELQKYDTIFLGECMQRDNLYNAFLAKMVEVDHRFRQESQHKLELHQYHRSILEREYNKRVEAFLIMMEEKENVNIFKPPTPSPTSPSPPPTSPPPPMQIPFCDGDIIVID